MKQKRTLFETTFRGTVGLAALSLGLAGASQAAPNAGAAPATTSRAAWGSRSVIFKSVILKIDGALTPAREAQLRSLGADVTRHLGFIGSVTATVSTRSLAKIAALPFVTHISDDSLVKKCDEFTDGSSGAAAAYQQYNLTGLGVTVAVLDTGIQCGHWDLLDANNNSRVTTGKDFSGSTAASTYSDYCGHGSHVAGIIAGNGAASTGSQCTHTYYGVARQANLINVRVLDQNGQGSVGSVLAGLQWVVQNKSAYNIRVINLSLGHPVGESYTTDPLCQAVEAAWKAGIVVVCAAGNSGRANTTQAAGGANEGWGTAYGTINSPGNDPYVITVGATKSMDGNRWHDRIATYSGRGPSRLDLVLKPDIIAPGNKVISLDVDYATLNAAYGGTNMLPYNAYTTATASGSTGTLGAANRAGAGMSNAYFVLSGTSMATPVVAGTAALMLQANPSLTPDTIKARLMISADKWTDGRGANQHWIFQDISGASGTTLISGHTYRLVNVNSGMALDNTNWSTANGNRMQQWDNVGGASQQWTLTNLGGGYWKLINAFSGKVLDVGGSSTSAGGAIQQWGWAGNSSQQWGLVPVGDGSYKMVNRNSGFVADVYNNSLTHGTFVQQWYDNQTPSDPCTYGAGYLNIPAALQNTVVATQPARSPSLTQDASGNVYLNASGIMSATHIIWGTSVNDLHIIWGTNAISGSSALTASHIIWGTSVFSDHIIWGTSASAVDLTSTAIYGE